MQAQKSDLANLKYAFKIKQPKGGVFSIDE
jgi:hypothetical protein